MFQKTTKSVSVPASADLHEYVPVIYRSIRPETQDVFLYKETVGRVPLQGWVAQEEKIFTEAILEYLASWSYCDSFEEDCERRKQYCNGLRDTPDKNDLYRLFRRNKLRHGNMTYVCCAVGMLFPKLKGSAQALSEALSNRAAYEDLSYEKKLVFVEEALQLARVACNSLRKK